MQEYNQINQMTARDHIRVLFRQKGVILITILTVLITVLVGIFMKTPMYEAKVKMLITGQKKSQAQYYTDIGGGGIRSAQIALTQIEVATSDPVIERAVRVLGLAQKPLDYEKRFASKIRNPFIDMKVRSWEKKMEPLSQSQKEAFLFRLAMEDLRNRLEVEPVRDTDLFEIRVKDYNPLGAAITANVVSRSYAIFDLEQQFAEMNLKYGEKNLAVIQLKKAIEDMSKGLNGAPLPTLEAIGPATVKIIEQAKSPLRPAGIPRVLTVILALVLSVFLSIVFAFGFEYIDQRFKSGKEAESFLGIKYLGGLPKKSRREKYREVAEQTYLTLKEHGAGIVQMAGALPHDGTAAVAANLAAYFAETFEKNVLLIDADLSNPTVHKQFKLEQSSALAEVINGTRTLAESVRTVSPHLQVLSSGRSDLNPITLFESESLRRILKNSREQYDLVLMVSAPLAVVKDAVIGAPLADGSVLVFNERKTRRHVAADCVETMRAGKGRLLGFILTNRSFAIPKILYDRL